MSEGGSYHTDSQGRCLTCEGSGVFIEDDGFPVDCPDCSLQSETDQQEVGRDV